MCELKVQVTKLRSLDGLVSVDIRRNGVRVARIGDYITPDGEPPSEDLKDAQKMAAGPELYEAGKALLKEAKRMEGVINAEYGSIITPSENERFSDEILDMEKAIDRAKGKGE